MCGSHAAAGQRTSRAGSVLLIQSLLSNKCLKHLRVPSGTFSDEAHDAIFSMTQGAKNSVSWESRQHILNLLSRTPSPPPPEKPASTSELPPATGTTTTTTTTTTTVSPSSFAQLWRHKNKKVRFTADPTSLSILCSEVVSYIDKVHELAAASEGPAPQEPRGTF